MTKIVTLVGVLALVLSTAAPSRAADNDTSAAAAESLFQEARKLAEAKRYSEACPKFAASQKLAPAIGTLLNLADCYEKNNQLASAWARFHEAIALAQRLGRANREQTARERAEKLEPRLIKLSISTRSSAVEVKLDGIVVDRGALGTPIPVDAGKHTIEASAKGKKPFLKTIDVNDKAKSPSVEIPVLEDEYTGAAAVAPKGPAPNPESKELPFTPPPKEGPKSSWSGRKTLGIIVGSLGAVGLGVGTYYGIKARSSWKEAQTYCSVDYECEEAGVDLAARAKRFGNYGTIGFAAGGVLLVGGVVLFITAPSPKKTAGTGLTRIGVGPGSVILGGTF